MRIVHVLSVVYLVALGCSDDEPTRQRASSEDVGQAMDASVDDSGLKDTSNGAMLDASRDVGDAGNDGGGQEDGGSDASTTDGGGEDGGSSDGGLVPPVDPRDEGVDCTSSLTPMSTRFERDTCSVGHLCIPWDLVAGVTGASPIQSCVRPCTVDTDCGQNLDGTARHCVESGFLESTGAGRICVDRISEPDTFCGLSRRTTAVVPETEIQTGPNLVGCSGGTTCLRNFFTDVHPDEGVCMEVCDSNADCPTGLPYCNPAVFQGANANGQPTTIGVCSDRQRGLGSLCGTADPNKLGIITGCDTSASTPAGTLCVPGQANLLGLDLPAGLGLCATLCNAGRPCGSDPALGPMTCSPSFLTFQNEQVGLCGSNCTQFPNSCTGPGGLGAGRFCGPAATEGAEFCVEVVPPTLIPGTIANGILDQNSGDNCLANPGDQLSCPQGSHCIAGPNGLRGWCLFGCSRATGAPNTCDQALGSTNTRCEQLLTDETVGLCGR